MAGGRPKMDTTPANRHVQRRICIGYVGAVLRSTSWWPTGRRDVTSTDFRVRRILPALLPTVVSVPDPLRLPSSYIGFHFLLFRFFVRIQRAGNSVSAAWRQPSCEPPPLHGRRTFLGGMRQHTDSINYGSRVPRTHASWRRTTLNRYRGSAPARRRAAALG